MLPSLVVTGIVQEKKICYFFCHVTSRDFVVGESCDTMGGFPSSLVTTLKSLVIIDLLEEEILSFQFVM